MLMRATAVRLGGAWAMALALAACHTTPLPPLMSPLDQAKRYGYAERDLAPDRVEVTYLGPRQRVTAYVPLPRDADTQPARAEAIDYATWRAAQIALARGFKGFRIVDRQTQVETSPEAVYAGPEIGAFPYWRYPTITYGPPGFYGAPAINIQARAVLTVELRTELGPGDDDAVATISRLRGIHPAAEAPSAGSAPEKPPQ